uniref:Uncharacterized protein n=1 Tax=Rhizophora mucronata TaxID=61149 RepID=A0A2P2LIA4_RHIMU
MQRQVTSRMFQYFKAPKIQNKKRKKIVQLPQNKII